MFWKPYEDNGYLSQWYPCTIVENEVTFNTAEQYMMYHKALLFNDLVMAKKILETDSPKTVKSLGRQISNFDEDTWVTHREKIILQGNYLKFSQNEELKQFMFGCPKKCIFVEASPYDRIYGVGYNSKAALHNRKNWGLNLLGRALNTTYQKLRE